MNEKKPNIKEFVEFRERGYEFGGLIAEPYNHFFFDYQWMVIVTDKKNDIQSIFLIMAKSDFEAAQLAIQKFQEINQI